MAANYARGKVSEFSQFWRGSKNALSRSAILMHRLIYDLQFAASRGGYFLEVYKSEVDQDGFDVILDDRDNIKKLQVKTVTSGATTSSWKIHKAMLRPHRGYAEELGFECSPEGSGYQGAVVLMDFTPDDLSIQVDYYYVDVFVLKAFCLGILSRLHNGANDSIKRLYLRLQHGTSHETTDVRKSAFVRSKGPEQVLALAGLHGPVGGGWPYSLRKFISEQKDFDKSYAAHELRQLIGDKDVSFCSPPLKEAETK